MQQGDDSYDDDYYDDDDDDYYDDEEPGPSPLVVILVGVALLMGLGAAGLAGYIFVQQSKDVGAPGPTVEVTPDEPEDADLDGSAGSADPATGPAVDPEEPGPDVSDGADASWTEPPTESWTPSGRRERGGARYSDPGSTSRNSRGGDSGSPRTSSRDRSSSGSSDRGRSSERSSLVRRNSGTDDRSSTRSREVVVEASRDDDEFGGPGTGVPGGEDPRLGEIIGGTAASSARRERGYDKQELQALGPNASAGDLDRDDVDHLKDVPSNHKNFTLAWSTVLKNADSKRDYREHCSAAQRIMSLPQNKYHPEWNLEMAKCHMRNGMWSAAARSVDRTLSDSFGMASATKSKRVLLAHEIRAISKTQIYEQNAKSNSGMSDDVKLRSAIQAWTDYKTFARGIGDTSALQRADKELADLEGKMN